MVRKGSEENRELAFRLWLESGGRDIKGVLEKPWT